MSAQVHPFTGDTSKSRTHITIPIGEFSEKLGLVLADCENKGGRCALLIAEANAAGHFKALAMMEDTREMRARLWQAQIELIIRGVA